jgi:hypothetical protein
VSKRSSFEGRVGDFYPTPRSAVLPLLPYLRGIQTFAKPCAGKGSPVRHLESFGLRCVCQSDVRAGQDALNTSSAFCQLGRCYGLGVDPSGGASPLSFP